MRRILTAATVGALAAAGLLAGAASPAAAAPPTPSFGPAIEALASYDPENSCDPDPKPGVEGVRDVLDAAYGEHTAYITRECSSATSEHEEGRALDYMLDAGDPADKAVATDLIGWLLADDQYGNEYAMARRLGVMYIIWNRQEWSAHRSSEGWRPYDCDGTPGGCHTNHVHISFSWAGALQQTSWWTQGGGVPAPGSGAGSDVDGNKGADLVLTTADPAGGTTTFALRSTYERFLPPESWWRSGVTGWNGVTPLAADVNGDHKADHVYLTNQGVGGTRAFVALSNGSTWADPQLWWDGAGWGYAGIKPALGDVDGNGSADLVLTTNDPAGGTTAFVLRSTGQGFQAPAVWWRGAVYGWAGVTPLVGDVNGDARADFVYLTNEGAGGTRGWVSLSTGGGFAGPQLWWNGAVWGYGGIKAALGDVDGNRGADLVLTTNDPAGGTTTFVLRSTYQAFLAPEVWLRNATLGWAGVTPLVGDVNGDLKADYVYLTNEGANGTRAFTALSGGAAFGGPELWWTGTGYGYTGLKAYLR